ncbi:hypothetical protein BH11PLA2_BH11PLA2_18380 [soil metagenome]
MDPTTADLARIREHYTHGRYRQALTAFEPFGPFRSLTSTPARLLAGRLAMQVGAPRLGRKLHAAAFRSTPSNLEAAYYHARYRFERFGPLSAVLFVREQTDWSDASPDLRGDWLAFQGFLAARLRDPDRAEKYLTQAEKFAPQRPWIRVERAAVLEANDKLDAALASAEDALQLLAWFRPAVQAKSHLLLKMGRGDEAHEFLVEAVKHLESGVLAAQLAAMQIERDDFTAAAVNVERYAELSPLLEADGKKWLAARRADCLYHAGDFPAAAEQARQVGEDFYTSFGERLNKPLAANPRKVLSLDLDFKATPPSVYDLLGKFWKLPTPPAITASVPPVDGLPDYGERRRFEDAGWHCVEFCLNAETAATLIDAGTPFFITLVEVGVSQARLVIGYDRYRGSLLLADGMDRKPSEAPIDVLLKRYASTGPRCLLALPPTRKNDGERHRHHLPDAAAYDRLYILQKHLAEREFQKARNMFNAIRQEAPKHRLTKFAAVSWARGTLHPALLLDSMAALLNEFPDDGTFLLTRAAALRELGRMDERFDMLKVAGTAPDADPLLMQSLAQMQLADCRYQDDAEYLLRRSLRLRPHAAAGYYLLASQRWEHQRFSESVELYRMACCLDDREEQFADAYFRVARAVDRVPEALRLFQLRANAEEPQVVAVKALFSALVDRDESESAFAMLDKAIEKLSSPLLASGRGVGVRGNPLADKADEQQTQSPPGAAPHPQRLSPMRGEGSSPSPAAIELSLFRAEMHAQAGDIKTAEAELAALIATAPPLEYHRGAARIARLKPDPNAAVHHLKMALDIDPLWIEGQRMLLVLLAETEGKTAARDAANALARRFPHHYGLHRLRVEFLTAFTDDDSAIVAARDLLDLCSHDAWARRQLALILADRGRDTEAKAEIDRAAVIEPNHPSQYAVMAHVHRSDDRIDAALDTYKAAIRKNVDHDLAVAELVNLSRGRAEKRSALRFVAEQLHEQPHTGDGLVAYRDQTLSLAASDDDADDHADLLEELGDELNHVLDDRPDLWQAWSLVIQQHGLMQRFEEAASLAREATARFPLLAHLWADLARVYAAQEMDDERIEALKSAMVASPGWSPAALELSEALAENGEDEEAISVLKRAVARAPQDPAAQVSLADKLWNNGESEEALERAKRAVLLDPGFDPAWRMVMHWADRLDKPEDAMALARELTRCRPGDPRGWLRLARLLQEPQQHLEALKALETVIRLEPTNVEAHDQKAERLAEIGQFEEALAAATPSTLAADLPLVLQGRAAWIEAKRGNYPAAIPPMQKLVSIEPEYFWGWQQLAEWYNETGRNEGFLEASSELCRLKPDHPLPLTFRGEAKLKTGDRSGGKVDLRDALRIAPQYAPAAAILFDACLKDGEQRDARSALAVLQEHAGGVEVLAKQVQFCCCANDSEGAMRALAEIAETPGDHPPIALHVALKEIADVGWEEKAAKVLKTSWQTGGSFNPWAALCWLDTPHGETSSYEDRIAAVDAAIAAYPTFAAAYDRKAEMLSMVGKADEAIACCSPGPFGDKVPLTLRGRAAWIEARRGRRGAAIALMTDAVREDPAYLWGWRNLTQWYDSEGRHRDCLDAADHMVKLAPDDPLAYGYRGEARRILGDRPGAKADFQKAFELDPAFDAAGIHLIAEQLHAHEVDAASHTLSRLQEHSSGPMVKLRGVQVAAALGNLGLARQRLRALCADSSIPKSLMAEAAKAFDDGDWTHEADDEFTAAVTGPDATPAAASVWAERLLKNDRGVTVMDSLPSLFERNAAAGREAALVYAVNTAKAGRPDAAAEVMHRFANQLLADDITWSAAGAALSTAGLHALAVNWLSDWRTRDGVEPAMLVPLTESLRALDRDADAMTVSRDAVELGGEPPAELLGWLALNDVIEGNTSDAAKALSGIDRIGLPDGTRLLIVLAEAAVMVQQAGPDAKTAAFAEAKEHLKAAAGACASSDVPIGLAKWYKRLVTRLACDAGSLNAKMWATWQKLRPWVK